MSTNFSLASRLEPLKEVPSPIREEIARRLRNVVARKGRTLVEVGSRSDEVFFILKGEAKVTLYSPNGREVSVNTIGPGELFGEIAVLDGGPRSATVIASTDINAVAMSAADFKKCLQSSTAVGFWLAKRLVSGIRRLTDKVFELSALNVQTRIHCELLRLAEKGTQTNHGIEIDPAPTHAEIANRIGTHREAVTREMTALEVQNIIRRNPNKRKGFTILDTSHLETAVYR